MSIKKYYEEASRKTNEDEAERECRETCLLYESQSSISNQPLFKEYQEDQNYYYKASSLYLTKHENNRTKLIIYDTESETEAEIILNTPKSLNFQGCIARLPNNDLFCFGADYPPSGIALMIHKSYEVRILPSGKPCRLSSVIYFNNSIYCFGGMDNNHCTLALSSKFYLKENRWINLAPMPLADMGCHSVIFNGIILISGYENKKLLFYSIDIDSFSLIPYEFAKYTIKILINAERLYLIECCWDGIIYESEDGYSWKQISQSIINMGLNQVYCLYNKSGIYIAVDRYGYYKFDLGPKIMIKLKKGK